MVATVKTMPSRAQSIDLFGYRPSWKQFTLCLVIAFSFCQLAANNTATAATYYVDDANGNDDANGSIGHPWKTLARVHDVNMYWVSGMHYPPADYTLDPNPNAGDTVYYYNGNYGTFLEAANFPAEPVHTTDWITHKVMPGHTPELNDIYISGARSGFADSQSHLKFDGFKINDGVYLKHSSHLWLKNCAVTRIPLAIDGNWSPYYSLSTFGVYALDGNNLIVQDCNIYGAYRGILVVNDNVTHWTNTIVTGNTVHSIAGIGILIGDCCDSNVSYNLVYDIDNRHAPVGVLGTRTKDFTVGETVRQANSGAVGIVTANASDRIMVLTISTQEFEGGNTCHPELSGNITGDSSGAIQTMAGGSDVDARTDGVMIGLESTDYYPAGVVVRGNTLLRLTPNAPYLNNETALKIAAIRPAYMSNITIENNVIRGTIIWGSLQGNFNFNNNTIYGGNELVNIAPKFSSFIIDNMFNNIFPGNYGGTNSGFSIQTDVNVPPNYYYARIINHGNNIFGTNPNGQGGPSYPFVVNGTELVNYNIDSLFVNAANNDFNLAPTSAAINFGNPNYGPISDILGNSRSFPPDAGCYEYVASDPNNHATVLETIGNKSVGENSLLSFTVTANDADSDPITYSAGTLPSGATFVGQTFSWTPGYTQAGTYSVTFRASDGKSQDSEAITITVNNTNLAPVLAAIGNKSVNEGITLSFSINATDADGDTITYSAQSPSSGAAFAGRTFTWTPGYNQAGAYEMTFIASDGQAQDSETISITVNNVNQAPVLSPIGNKSAFANDRLAFSVSATEPDGDTITYSATGLPSGATFISPNFSWTPTPSQVGSYHVTFTASDGQLQDSEAVTITVYSADTSAPTVNGLSPAADSIQVPLNSLVILHVTDNGKGVDANSVTIKVNNNTVYTGNTADYSSSYGHCRRAGTEANYSFIYQPNAAFDYDQTVNVAVNAKDLAGNTMNQYSYSFATEMRSFGKNKIVNSASDSFDKGNPATVLDSEGNIWAAWHTGQTNSREIYVGKLAAGADDFDASIQVTNNSADQYNAAIAIDASDKLYLVWQDNRRGNWDIYISTSVDGINWSAERRVTDSNNNATNPAIAVDHSSPPKAYIAWQEDRASNQEIYIASSSDGFATGTISGITSDSSNQIDPAIAVNASNTVYVVWADSRNGSSDIYGAASNNGPWTNVPVVVKPANQTSPAIATEAAGAILHLLWVDDTTGNKDIYYVSSNGLPTTPLTGRNIVDDSSGANQLTPAIITTGSTGSSLKVFACWQDKRNAGSGGDTDIYFVDVNSNSGTNIFTGDDATNSNQSAPAIGIDGYGYPYLVWADDRNQHTDIYYAGSTYVHPNTLASQNVSPSLSAIIGTNPADITSVDDVSIVIPAGAYPCELNITISKVENPPKLSTPLFSFVYEFGPSGAVFDKPVTITIPYNVSANSQVSAYWYNTLADAISQQGLTDVNTIVISSTLHAFRFKTTHFTSFLIGGSSGGSSGGSGGGGGCALSSPGQASFVEFLLPYIGLAAVMIVINRRDKRKREISSATGNEH